MDTSIFIPQTATFLESNGFLDFTVQLTTHGDWSLAGFYGEQGLKEKPELARDLFELFYAMGAEKIYAPTPIDFNAKLINPEAFITHMPLEGLGTKVLMLRNKARPADGTVLRNPGDAGVFSGGGCPMIVAAYKDKLAFAHAGRDCLLDRVRVDSNGEKEGRPYGSVVTNLMEALKGESFEFDSFDHTKVRAWVYGSICPEDFTHPLSSKKYGLFNGKMYGYVVRLFGPECVEMKDCAVQLNLPILIQQQFMLLGVPGENIDLSQAYLPQGYPTTRNGSKDKYLAVVLRRS